MDLLVPDMLSYLRTAFWIVVGARVAHNHTPHLRSRVTLLEVLVIIPHQLAIRFRHNCLLRVRVHRSSTIETETRVVHRCGDVGFVSDEELGRKNKSAIGQRNDGNVASRTNRVWVRHRKLEPDRQGFQY